MKRHAVLAVLLLAMPLAAYAQPKPAPHTPAPQILNIEDGEVLEGTKAGPDAEMVVTTGRPRHDGVIQTRTNFKDKVLASVSEM